MTIFYSLRFETSLFVTSYDSQGYGRSMRPRLYTGLIFLSPSLILRSTVSGPVSLGIKHPFRAYDHIFITVRQLRFYWCGELSLTRGRVCRLQWLMALASAVIFGSGSRGIRDRILLSHVRDFPFRRFLRLSGIRTHVEAGSNTSTVANSFTFYYLERTE
jgi:hypothetical protein